MGDMDDATLLKRYARSRDAEAFAALARRYGGLVYGVCLRELGNEHDAADAAQECFVDLAGSAGSISSSLAGWLHACATHRCLDAVRAASRRRRHEGLAVNRNAERTGPMWADVGPHVDRLIEELPEDLRVPLVLHFLQGESQGEVAADLGVNQSTVSRRMERGLALLRDGLKKAGVIASVAVVGSLLAENAAQAAPAGLTAALGKMAMAGVGHAAGAATAVGGAGAAGTTTAASATAAAAASAPAAAGIGFLHAKLVIAAAVGVLVVGGAIVASRLAPTSGREAPEPARQTQTVPAEPVRAAGAPSDIAAIAPYIDQQAMLVVRVDVERASPEPVFAYLLELAERSVQDLGDLPAELRSARDQTAQLRDQFLKAGGRTWHLIQSYGTAAQYFLITLGPEADLDALHGIHGGVGRAEPCERLGDLAYVGPAERLAELREAAPPLRPSLEEASAAVADMPLQYLFVPTQEWLNAAMAGEPEGQPELQKLLTAGALRWMAMGLEGPPKARLKLVVQCRDAEAAKALRFGLPGWLRVNVDERTNPTAARLFLAHLMPAAQGDRLVCELEGAELEQAVMLALRVQHIQNMAAQVGTSAVLMARACRTYAEHHDGQWPEDLRALIPTYIPDEEALKNPRLPDREVGFVYRPPLALKPGSADAHWTLVLYEAYEEWPEGGLVVGFASGRAGTCKDEAELRNYLAETEKAEAERLARGAHPQEE